MTTPSLRTVRGHGDPERAMWHGIGTTPEFPGRPCMVERTGSGYRVQVDGQRAWLLTNRRRVWLAPLTDPAVKIEPAADLTHARRPVDRPTIVPLRLAEPTLDAYRLLSHALTGAANAANDAAAACRVIDAAQAADLVTVRDALRSAANAALLGRGYSTPEPCRRCGTSCTSCNPREATL